MGVRRGARVLSRRVLAVEYVHAESEQRAPYRHAFGPGVLAELNPDGSVTLRHRDGRTLWDTFTVGDTE